MTPERNPNANKFILPTGYRDLGWQLYSGNSPEIKACLDAGHSQQGGQITEFDNSLFKYLCTDVIRMCLACKIASHTDMSD